MLNDIVTLALACAWREIGNISTTDRRTEEKLMQHLPGYLLGSNDNETLALACAWRDVGAKHHRKMEKVVFSYFYFGKMKGKFFFVLFFFNYFYLFIYFYFIFSVFFHPLI